MHSKSQGLRSCAGVGEGGCVCKNVKIFSKLQVGFPYVLGGMATQGSPLVPLVPRATPIMVDAGDPKT